MVRNDGTGLRWSLRDAEGGGRALRHRGQTGSHAAIGSLKGHNGLLCIPKGYSCAVHTVQRSFRLTQTTCDLLDARARAANESRNALVERLLAEALRTEQHPLITFRGGAAGRREPLLIGTRILVRQVMPIVRADGVDQAAPTLDLPPHLVQAAVAYYADFQEEVDADTAWAAEMEAHERARWERQQAASA